MVFLHPLISILLSVCIMALQSSLESYTLLSLETVMLVRLEQREKTFSPLLPVWNEIAEDHPECILYEPTFFKKLTQIDNSILISNVHSTNQAEIQKVIKKVHG